MNTNTTKPRPKARPKPNNNKKHRNRVPALYSKDFPAHKKLVRLDPLAAAQMDYCMCVVQKLTGATNVSVSTMSRYAAALLAHEMSKLWNMADEDLEAYREEILKTLRIVSKGTEGNLVIDDLSKFEKRIPPFKVLWAASRPTDEKIEEAKEVVEDVPAS